MDILWLIGFFFGIDFLCGTYSSAHISVLEIPKNSTPHGTQYRFQYYVRDERGDYKTQEEAGEGGKARGSYAVEEPDGDLRIVQYTADIGGGFKAHIKVDHGGKTPTKLQEIDIPAEEMRKLIEENRKKSVEDEEEEQEIDESSKSYVLGPPKKMSDIIMEQAAAIREIISKEIEAEEKREAEEKLKNSQTAKEIVREEESSVEKRSQKTTAEKITSENLPPKNSSINSIESRTSKGRKIEEKDTQSPVVRVALSPRNIEEINPEDLHEKSEFKYREIQSEKQIPSGPVRNFSFRNKIMFYKPAEKKSNQNQPIILSNDDEKLQVKEEEKEEILLYSPYQDEGKVEGDRKSKFITVPYEVLRPYLTEAKKDEEKSHR